MRTLVFYSWDNRTTVAKICRLPLGRTAFWQSGMVRQHFWWGKEINYIIFSDDRGQQHSEFGFAALVWGDARRGSVFCSELWCLLYQFGVKPVTTEEETSVPSPHVVLVREIMAWWDQVSHFGSACFHYITPALHQQGWCDPAGPKLLVEEGDIPTENDAFEKQKPIRNESKILIGQAMSQALQGQRRIHVWNKGSRFHLPLSCRDIFASVSHFVWEGKVVII